jgi:caa(3)-type oxidase subunit IV
VAWLALVLLAIVTIGSAHIPLGAFNTPMNLAIAAIMVVILWLFLMDLIDSDVLVRLIARCGPGVALIHVRTDFHRLSVSALRSARQQGARTLCRSED